MDGEDLAFMALITEAPGPDIIRVGTHPADLPSTSGAYLLLLRLEHPIDIPRPSLSWRFEAGSYVYAGSAYGPGGLRARVGRHLRRDKRLHWHIDHLTRAADSLSAMIAPGASECALIERLLASGAFTTPCAGFGSSDCRQCAAHLLHHTGSSPEEAIVEP